MEGWWLAGGTAGDRKRTVRVRPDETHSSLETQHVYSVEARDVPCKAQLLSTYTLPPTRVQLRLRASK